MPNDCHTLIELAPCGEPYPCGHMSCDCEPPSEFVSLRELLCRQAERYAEQRQRTGRDDDHDG